MFSDVLSNLIPKLTRVRKPLAIAAVVFVGSPSAAEDTQFTLRQTVGFTHEAEMIDDGGAQSPEFVNTPYLQTQWDGVRPLPDNAKLSYGADVTVSGSDNAAIDAQASLAYQRNFGEQNTWQLRLAGTADRSISDEQWTFQRERLAVRLQKRHSPEHTTYGQVRLGYRDQNEATFDGYDQSEIFTELTHMWRPNRDRMAFSGTLYTEARNAEFDQYSYDEAGLRMMFRMPISEATEFTARTTYYQRDFRDAFSMSDPTLRADERINTRFEVSHAFSDTISSVATVGWDDNMSTIADRAYAGATVGLSVTINLK